MSHPELIQIFQEARDLMGLGVGYGHLCEALSFGGERMLKKILIRRHSFSHEAFSLLTSPTKPSFLHGAQELLWRIRRSTGKKQSHLIEEFLGIRG